jgi:hypothetical protein
VLGLRGRRGLRTDRPLPTIEDIPALAAGGLSDRRRGARRQPTRSLLPVDLPVAGRGARVSKTITDAVSCDDAVDRKAGPGNNKPFGLLVAPGSSRAPDV